MGLLIRSVLQGITSKLVFPQPRVQPITFHIDCNSLLVQHLSNGSISSKNVVGEHILRSAKSADWNHKEKATRAVGKHTGHSWRTCQMFCLIIC